MCTWSWRVWEIAGEFVGELRVPFADLGGGVPGCERRDKRRDEVFQRVRVV